MVGVAVGYVFMTRLPLPSCQLMTEPLAAGFILLAPSGKNGDVITRMQIPAILSAQCLARSHERHAMETTATWEQLDLTARATGKGRTSVTPCISCETLPLEPIFTPWMPHFAGEIGLVVRWHLAQRPAPVLPIDFTVPRVAGQSSKGFKEIRASDRHGFAPDRVSVDHGAQQRIVHPSGPWLCGRGGFSE